MRAVQRRNDRLWLTPVAVAYAVAIVVTLGCCACSAQALIAQGHVYGSSFGSAGSGDGELAGPSQVAVDEATGEVFVVDAGNERVEVFKPAAGGAGYEYAAQFKVHTPGAIAVDNSTSATDPSRGMVYVAGGEEKEAEEDDLIYEYDPVSEEVVHRWHTFEYREPGTGLDPPL